MNDNSQHQKNKYLIWPPATLSSYNTSNGFESNRPLSKNSFAGAMSNGFAVPASIPIQSSGNLPSFSNKRLTINDLIKK